VSARHLLSRQGQEVATVPLVVLVLSSVAHQPILGQVLSSSSAATRLATAGSLITAIAGDGGVSGLFRALPGSRFPSLPLACCTARLSCSTDASRDGDVSASLSATSTPLAA